MPNGNSHRVLSLDLLRGVVMVIMALDHIRDYIYYGAFANDPTNLATTTPPLFFTRWITHFCAPVFVFLAGAAAFLYGLRQGDTKKTALFLWTRGVWLIFVELAIVNLGLSFDIHYSFHILQVIWAIGISMICLSALIRLPQKALLAFGLLVVAGHNLLDGITFQGHGPLDIMWYLLHQQNLLVISPDSVVLIAYPVLPWIGVMALGYVFGSLYDPGFDTMRRKALLWKMGLGAVALFFLLRTFNWYGDPAHWAPQSSFAFSVISFFNTTKYPPSLVYLCMTIGPALLFMYWAEGKNLRPQNFFSTIGRVPFFYYVIHFFVAHLIGELGVLYAGRPWTDGVLSAQNFLNPRLADYGYSLPVTYAAWALVIAIMYPLCRWYDRYKRNNRDKWWLSYL